MIASQQLVCKLIEQDFVNLLEVLPPNFNELDQRRLQELLQYINSIEFPNKSQVIEQIKNAKLK